jgi:DNA polymerase
VIYIDFETRSEVDLKKSGAAVYSEHPSTEILCLAVAKDDGPALGFLDIYDIGLKDLLSKAISSGETFEAHNSFFEYQIFKNILSKKLNIDFVPTKQWQCTAAMAASSGLPRALGKAAEVAGLPQQKDNEGRKLMLKMCKPRKPTKNNTDKWNESPEDRARLLAYCVQDVITERALSKKLRVLSPEEKKIWHMDAVINDLGVYVDSDSVEASLELLGELKTENDKRVFEITEGSVESVSQRQRVINWCESKGVILESFTAPFLREFLASENIPEEVREVLSIRLSLGKTSTAKYTSFKAMTSKTNRAKGLLLYHGAHTGRWSGKGIQPQNFPRPSGEDVDVLLDVIALKDLSFLKICYDDPMLAISRALRGVICAPKGKKLIGADYSSIEARVLLWASNDEKGLELFRAKKDLYIDMAASIFNIGASVVSKEQRRLGKVAILGLGYGMGVNKFHATCMSQGIDISESLAKKIVRAYRNKYSSVVRLWRGLEACAKEAMASRSAATFSNVGFFYPEGRTLYCTLPSGRTLSYVDPVVDREDGSTEDRLSYGGVSSSSFAWVRKSTWGGKLVENVVQAIARDIMCDAMLRLHEAGHRIVLTVHDELVLECEKDTNVSILLDAMHKTPAWAEGLPIGAEAWEGSRYSKG